MIPISVLDLLLKLKRPILRRIQGIKMIRNAQLAEFFSIRLDL